MLLTLRKLFRFYCSTFVLLGNVLMCFTAKYKQCFYVYFFKRYIPNFYRKRKLNLHNNIISETPKITTSKQEYNTEVQIDLRNKIFVYQKNSMIFSSYMRGLYGVAKFLYVLRSVSKFFPQIYSSLLNKKYYGSP